MEDLPTRWEIELEFVQSLANMQYLTYLAQTGNLEDPNFLRYLEYLDYWRDPKYAKHLVYPNCLHILSLLKSPKFRKDIATTELSTMVYNDMVERWKEPLKTATTPKNVQNTDAASIEAGQSQLDQEKTNQTLDSVNTESDGDAVGKAAIGATSAEKQTSDGDTAMSTNA